MLNYLNKIIMKLLNFTLIFFLISFSVFCIYCLNSFSSAFEADQQCHADLISNFGELLDTGCDHDLETHQWILFQKQDSSMPAIVLKRYRY
tara:strand:+ start:3730 stop:4002 length:273 start_codon:yes stop_codon:yes gene_type:complete